MASLVLGILWLCGVGSLLATIFGAVALGQIAKSNGRLTGKAMAIAGLVLGIIGLGLLAFPFFHGMVRGAIEPPCRTGDSEQARSVGVNERNSDSVVEPDLQLRPTCRRRR